MEGAYFVRDLHVVNRYSVCLNPSSWSIVCATIAHRIAWNHKGNSDDDRVQQTKSECGQTATEQGSCKDSGALADEVVVMGPCRGNRYRFWHGCVQSHPSQ